MTTQTLSTAAVAARFNELAKQEKWFEIQDELFSDDVKSIEPSGSKNFSNAHGKADVKKKGEDFIKGIEGVHELKTGEPIVSDHHFAVTRITDLDLKNQGRVRLNEIMLYEVRDGKIISEQFFYKV